MPAHDRLTSRGTRRSRQIRAALASEVRDARIRAGLSQDALGQMLGMSGDKVGRIERSELATLSFADAAQLGAVLGLDLAARFYPNGSGIRDAGQAKRLGRFLTHVGSPLRFRTDMQLPQKPGELPELRAWDALIWDPTARTGVELEARLTDIQPTVRRHGLKRRDEPVDHFLLAIADTAHNRRVMLPLTA